MLAVEIFFSGRFSKNIFQAQYCIFGGLWARNFGISHIVNTLIHTWNIFITHSSHFYFQLHPTFRRVPRPKWKNVNFFQNLEKNSKTMGSKNGFFLLAYFRCIFIWNVFKWKNFWPISPASGWNWRFLKKNRQLFFRHFGGLIIGVGGWNFFCILVRCRPFDLIHF